MNPLRVLFVTSEIHPLVKTGGLADVSAALPAALRELDIDIRVLVPGYRQVIEQLDVRCLRRSVSLLNATEPARLLQGRLGAGDLPIYVLDQPSLFDREGGPYGDAQGRDWPDNALRFGALGRAAAEIASARSPLRWRANLIHGNDWQSGLAVAYAKLRESLQPKVVFSVHNIAFAGKFDLAHHDELELPEESLSMQGVEFYGALSFLKAGLYYADRLTTVSPTYANELQTDEYGGGFDGLLRARSSVLTGILNGVDEHYWNPATDAYLSHPYDASNLDEKQHNKRVLQRTCGLEPLDNVPLFGMVSRMTAQKGGDLAIGAIERLLGGGAQFIVLGTGDAKLEQSFERLSRRHPTQVNVTLGYDEALAHRIEAGADLFLMPSRFEPCGLNQMYSMLYATLPVVRATGGLADSVTDSTNPDDATGFSFDSPDVPSLTQCMQRAMSVYADKPIWRRMQLNAMRQDFSWKTSARAYQKVYTQAMRPVSNR